MFSSLTICHNISIFSRQQNPKIQQIKDIWAAGLGVVSLHIFQSVIPVEAYTREACMIDALGKFYQESITRSVQLPY